MNENLWWLCGGGVVCLLKITTRETRSIPIHKRISLINFFLFQRIPLELDWRKNVSFLLFFGFFLATFTSARQIFDLSRPSLRVQNMPLDFRAIWKQSENGKRFKKEKKFLWKVLTHINAEIVLSFMAHGRMDGWMVGWMRTHHSSIQSVFSFSLLCIFSNYLSPKTEPSGERSCRTRACVSITILWVSKFFIFAYSPKMNLPLFIGGRPDGTKGKWMMIVWPGPLSSSLGTASLIISFSQHRTNDVKRGEQASLSARPAHAHMCSSYMHFLWHFCVLHFYCSPLPSSHFYCACIAVDDSLVSATQKLIKVFF